MTRPLTIPMGADGLPTDDVSHYAANTEQLRSYEQAAQDLYRFKAPALFNQADPHSYLLIGLMDGTGNDVSQDPIHASNVAKFREQITKLKDAGVERIEVEYKEGPGTQTNPLEK